MDKVLSVEEALELENHFINAGKSLRCALRKMRNYDQFGRSSTEVAMTIIDVDDSARIMRQWVTDNT